MSSPPKWCQTVHYCFPMCFFTQANNWELLIYQESLVLYNKTFYHQLYQRTTKYCFYCTVLTDTNREKQDISQQQNTVFTALYQLQNTVQCTFFSYQQSTNPISENQHNLPLTCLTNLFSYLQSTNHKSGNQHNLPTNIHRSGEENTKNVKCVEQEKIMITCKKLILKEGEGERRTYYDLQTGRFFSGFLGFHFSLDMRPVRQ